VTADTRKEYTGLFIPKGILADRRFKAHEMIVYAYMANFGARFHASDRHMAARLGLSPKTIRNTVQRLRAKGFVVGQYNTRKPVAYELSLSRDNIVPEKGA